MRWSRIVPLMALAAVLALGSIKPAKADVSFDFYYSNLSPHGSWLVSGSYGQVWQPSVYRRDWNPYYDGHWVYTDYGWTWVSDYDWGAIPYHYGTWVYDGRYGWVWVPGYVWAPSWVVFRTGPDYIGWAPVSPSFSIGVSIGPGSFDSAQFVFVPTSGFLSTSIRTVVVPRSQTTMIINKTKIVNNTLTVQNNIVVNRGPSVQEIEKVSGKRIERVPIENVKGVAAGSRVDRQELRADRVKSKHGLRAAEPMTDKTPPPSARGERMKGDTETESAAPWRARSSERRPERRAERSETARPPAPPGRDKGLGRRPHGDLPTPSTPKASPSRPEGRSRPVSPPPAPSVEKGKGSDQPPDKATATAPKGTKEKGKRPEKKPE